MKYPLVCLFLFIFFKSTAQQENYFAKTMKGGSSLTFIPLHDEYDNRAREFIWNVNLGISITKRLFYGIQWMNFYSEGYTLAPDRYHLFGAFGQFNFSNNPKKRLFGELSINTGDYLGNDVGFPSRQKNQFYIGIGAGLEFPMEKIVPRLSLDLSTLRYERLWDGILKESWSFHQYIVGLNYKFISR